MYYSHSLNNDPFTVGLNFLSRKCGRYFNDSQAVHNCEVIVSSSGQLFSICVNWDRLRCRDRILMQKAHFSILTLLGSFLTQQCYIKLILSFNEGFAKVVIVNIFARHSNMQLQMSIILNNLKIKAYTSLLGTTQSYLKQNTEK